MVSPTHQALEIAVTPPTFPQILKSIDEVADRYDALLCDLWGCYHNGVEPYPAAVAALQRFRTSGGTVVLLTNAPRPSPAVAQHLAGMGAPQDSFDAIVSSGDATRAEISSGKWGRRLHLVGPDRDDSLWGGLDVEASSLADADAILCTGLFNDHIETPDDYADLVATGVARGLPFLCANPDIVVDRGEERLYCAGAIAEAYAAAGGRTIYFGKPHPPIYALALERLAETKDTTVDALDRRRVLAVGDGVNTDVLGADQAGIDCVFVSGGLALDEIGGSADDPDPAGLTQYLVANCRSPRYAIGRLR